MNNVKELDCLLCHTPTKVDAGTDTVVCSSCTTKAAGAPTPPATKIAKEPKMTKKGLPRARRGEGKPYQPSGFPRGWHFKKYYKHTDGRVFSRGKEVTDQSEIKQLETSTVE